MEAVQQDENPVAQPGAHGELDLADDGHEPEAQGEGTGSVRSTPHDSFHSGVGTDETDETDCLMPTVSLNTSRPRLLGLRNFVNPLIITTPRTRMP